MKINYWFIAAMFFILMTTFLIGASTCKISGYEWNTYKDKADCMTKLLDKMEEDGRVIDIYRISSVEKYCEQYDH